MGGLRDPLLVAAAAFVVVVATTPLTIWLSRRLGAVDQPGGRRVNTRPLPRLGGLALYAGLLGAFAVAWLLPTFRPVFRTTSDPIAFVLAATVITAVGVLDDMRGLTASAKLAGQAMAAGVLVLFGVLLRFVYIPGELGTVSLNADLAALLTIAGVVAMINAVNLVDGLDGLASGVVAIATVALLAHLRLTDQALRFGDIPSPQLLLATVLGACLAFLLFNFHPAKVIMGDTGAMLLGLLLGAAGVSAVGGTLAPGPGAGDFAALSIPVLVPALVMAVPLIDTAWAILRRLRTGRAVFSPDKKHLHHRLLELGHSQQRAALIVYLWSALAATAAVSVGLLPLWAVLGLLATGAAVALAVTLAGRRDPRRHRAADEGRPRL
ncbi:MAG: undecaprenyl-phosphate alpha-N-acetylglucosaminyl 1-phosphate transferase [Actinobacteria bacterium QS_8_72_14]|nr:MAG: undecaprenyl-phosphate alpha-N-acetylglucosaminyl 1-phosphate transferase [Actinobacteria bacterium QS_8_72_14]